MFLNKLLEMFSKDWSNRQVIDTFLIFNFKYFVMMVNANFVVDEMMPALTKCWVDVAFEFDFVIDRRFSREASQN